jgi:thymidylate synthase
MLNVVDIRDLLVEKYLANEFVIDKTGVKTVELIGQSFIADEPTIFGKVNGDYIERELAWYKSQSLFVDDIPGETPAIWKAVASTEGKINSNYGYLVYSGQNNYQYGNVYNELCANKDSRRAIMIYTRPTIWNEYNHNGMSDFICTNTVQYLIRDNKLNAVVSMRSNDAIFGYKNDFAWQKYVLDQLVGDLRVGGSNHQTLEAGNIIWNSGSLHVYERHFKFIEEFIK